MSDKVKTITAYCRVLEIRPYDTEYSSNGGEYSYKISGIIQLRWAVIRISIDMFYFVQLRFNSLANCSICISTNPLEKQFNDAILRSDLWSK